MVVEAVDRTFGFVKLPDHDFALGSAVVVVPILHVYHQISYFHIMLNKVFDRTEN